MSVSLASPGPFTTQPITDSVNGVVMWARRRSSTSTVLITWKAWRAHDGQAITVTPRRRSPSARNISLATLTSSTGSAASETRMVSPMPAISSMPSPTDDFTVPLSNPPASVMPR